jgi:hypothetical protein
MDAIFSPQKREQGNEPASDEGIEKSIPSLYHEINITEGGEFLDDALRMKDQPLEEPNEKLLQKV